MAASEACAGSRAGVPPGPNVAEELEAAAERRELTTRQAFALARARAAILRKGAIGASDAETAEKRETP